MDYRNLNDLSGRIAVITGAASGIGSEAAKALGECGAKLELIDLNRDNLLALAGRLNADGIETHITTLDVTDATGVDEAAEELNKRWGAADILLNSAGIAMLHSISEVSVEDWKRVIDVDLNGTVWPSRAYGKYMVKAGKGSVINMGSMSGTIINRPQFASSYMAAKGAVHQLTRALAVEWARTGVRVNALAPGYVATEMTLAMRDRPELFETWMDMTPMGRCGTPEEIAAVIVFLASDASTYMTGSIVPVDGGYTSF